MTSGISFYGTVRQTYKTHRQRYWKKRSDGIKQRYWRKVQRIDTKARTARINIYGKKEDVIKASQDIRQNTLVPKDKFMTVAAKDFLANPDQYVYKGQWTRSYSDES